MLTFAFDHFILGKCLRKHESAFIILINQKMTGNQIHKNGPFSSYTFVINKETFKIHRAIPTHEQF